VDRHVNKRDPYKEAMGEYFKDDAIGKTLNKWGCLVNRASSSSSHSSSWSSDNPQNFLSIREISDFWQTRSSM